MTTDFQLGYACPHLTVEERVLLSSDRRSLETRQPVSSEDFVQITVNNGVNIPKEGLLSPAQITGAISGPFMIRQNENTITLRNSQGLIEDFALPVGTRVEAGRIVDLINAQRLNQGIGIVAESLKGYLRFSDIDVLGPASRIEIRGPAAEQIGFVSQIAAKGATVFPAWEMAEREDLVNTINLNQLIVVTNRFPKFVKPLRSDPVIKVTYATIQSRCRRCRTVGFENDMRFDIQGEPVQITNEDLLNQGLLKLITTEKGSNPFHNFYGTDLHARIGMKASGAAVTTITEDILRAVDSFKRLQEIAGQFQNVSARERLYTVLSVNVSPSAADPTVFLVEIVGSNASGQQVTVSTVFAAPGSAALVGSNGQSLGLAPTPPE
jgi:hypothetical protein